MSASLPVYEKHYDGVLGTSLDITIFNEDLTENDAALDLALSEIARLEHIFSIYREDSELMRLNSERSKMRVSDDLFMVVEACDAWYERSDGKFSCRLGQVVALWDEAETEQTDPDRIAIRRLARDANLADIRLDRETTSIALDQAISLDTSGLAKGYIIDRTLEILRQVLPEAEAIKVDIGGDALYWGKPPGQNSWTVAIADPNNTADNQGYLATLKLDSMAVAASGHNSRTRVIGRRTFSHILTPRDGWPVEAGLSAIVIAPDALTADAVATALSVQTLSEGIDWVNDIENVEALLIDVDGRQMSSLNWQTYHEEDSVQQMKVDPIFTLDYVLPDLNISNYYRPYVAIWISDTEQTAVKNLLLLGETERWARENSRWWRRVGRRNPQLLDGVARPTRGKGEYQLQWDGIDDFGDKVPAGDYILHLEASRENGGHTYQTIEFSLGQDKQSYTLDADGELGSILLQITGSLN